MSLFVVFDVFYYILLLVHLVSSQEQTVIQSLCMDNFVAMNIDLAFNSSIISDYELCYERIPNFEVQVHGYDIKSHCFIHKSFLHVNKGGILISRCGQWLQLVGPSQKTINCMVAGSIDESIEGISESLSRNIIGVPSSMFSSLTAGFDEVSGVFSQITMSETDFNLHINPTVVVLERNETHAELQFIDFNRPPEKIDIEGIVYRMTPQNTFIVPIVDHIIKIVLISFDDEKVDFFPVDLAKDESVYSNSRFYNNILTDCKFLPQTKIYERNNRTKLGKFLDWKIWQINENSVSKIDDNNQEVEFVSIDGIIKTSFVYPTAIMYSQEFSQLEAELQYENGYEFKGGMIAHQEEKENIELSDIKTISSSLKTIHHINQETKTIHIKAFFDRSSNKFANVFALVHSLPVGKKIILKKVELKRISTSLSQTMCDSSSFDCLGTECTITGESTYDGKSLWSQECCPACGFCRVGYQCSTTGKCIKEETLNTRSYSKELFVTLVLIVILTL